MRFHVLLQLTQGNDISQILSTIHMNILDCLLYIETSNKGEPERLEEKNAFFYTSSLAI